MFSLVGDLVPGNWLVHIAVPPMGLQTPSSPWVLSLAPSLGTLCSNQWMTVSFYFCIYQALADSLKRKLCQAPVSKNRVGICHSVWVWWLFVGWILGWGSLWMILSFISALNFVSVAPSMGILLPILRTSEISTLWPSFFLSFMCFANCILGILSFWANIHLP